MSEVVSAQRMSRPGRVYLLMRLIAFGVITVWSGWAAISYREVIDARSALAASVLFGVTTVIAYLLLRNPSIDFKRMLLWFAVPDLVVLGVLGLAFHAYQDPAYAMLFGLAALYAVFIRQRDTWTIGLGAAFVYLLIHVASPMDSDPMSYSLVLLKAIQLLVVSLILSMTAAALSRREEEINQRTAQEEQLNVQLQRRVGELQAISKISDVIHSTLDFDRVGPVVLDILTKVIDIPGCALFVVDKSKSETVFSASAGAVGASVKVRPREVDPSGGMEFPDAHFSCIPVVEHKQMMVVFCADSDEIEDMSQDDRLVLQAIASELAVAVENSQLYKLTRRMAITDDLTGLYNYRHLQQRLDEEIERARRYGKDLSLLMVDVDDFKRFNDTNGHVAGDGALRDLGTVIRSIVREVDVVCRYGGEEFSVVLPETDAAGAFVAAEKLREAVARHRFADAEGTPGERLTVSIGLSSYPAHAGDKDELLRLADDALYQAKNGGKDRVRSPRSRPTSPPGIDGQVAADGTIRHEQE